MQGDLDRDVVLTLQSIGSRFPFSTSPRFTFTLMNNSTEAIDLDPGFSSNSISLDYMGFGVRNVTEDKFVWAINGPPQLKRKTLAAGEAMILPYPFESADVRGEYLSPFERNRLLPGLYSCRMSIELHSGEQRWRVYSAPVEITVIDDGSPEIPILRARRGGSGVAEHLLLQARGKINGDIELYARNTGNSPLYLEDNWSWRWRRLFSKKSEFFTGASIGLVALDPGEKRCLEKQNIMFRIAPMERGIYLIDASYNPALFKWSNPLLMAALPPVYLTWPPDPLPTLLLGCLVLLVGVRIVRIRQRRRAKGESPARI
jgi:hypothetical protein